MRYNDEIKKIINDLTEKQSTNLEYIKEEDSEYNIYSENSSDSSLKVISPINLKRKNSHVNRNINRKLSNIIRHPQRLASYTHNNNNSFNNEFEVDKHLDKVKNELYLKFSNKIERIISFFKNKGITFDNIRGDDNPLNLLIKLKEIRDGADRNEIIEKLENSVSKLI